MVGYLPITLLHFSVFTLFIRNFAGENVEIHLRVKKTGLGMLLGGLGMLAGCLSPQQHGAEKQDEIRKSYNGCKASGWMTTRRHLYSKFKATAFIMPARLMPRCLFRCTMTR